MLKSSPLLLGEAPVRQRDPPWHPTSNLICRVSFWNACIFKSLACYRDIGGITQIWEHSTQADFNGALSIKICTQRQQGQNANGSEFEMQCKRTLAVASACTDSSTVED